MNRKLVRQQILRLAATVACLFWGGIMEAQTSIEPILHGSSERLRMDAVSAPLPEYPRATMSARKTGLVVIEVTVLPDGSVGKLDPVSSFDKDASRAMEGVLRRWRFVPVKKSPGVKGCDNCVRIARFLFSFTIDEGQGRVIDLAAAENQRHRGLPYADLNFRKTCIIADDLFCLPEF